MSKIHILLQNFSAKIGMLKMLELDDQGRLSLLIDEKFNIEIEFLEDLSRVHLYIVLGNAPDELSPSFLREMLEANFFGHATSGAVLSIDADMSDVLLERTLDLDGVTADSLAQAMEQLIQASGIWREKLQQAGHKGAGAGSQLQGLQEQAKSNPEPAFWMGRA